MAVRIGKERHPEIVVVHLRDQVRLGRERCAPPGQLADGKRDVGAAEIDAALRRHRARAFDLVEQEPHAGAIEKRQVAEAVELPQPHDLFIEGFRTIDVADRKRDLADLAEIEQHGDPLGAAELKSRMKNIVLPGRLPIRIHFMNHLALDIDAGVTGRALEILDARRQRRRRDHVAIIAAWPARRRSARTGNRPDRHRDSGERRPSCAPPVGGREWSSAVQAAWGISRPA